MLLRKDSLRDKRATARLHELPLRKLPSRGRRPGGRVDHREALRLQAPGFEEYMRAESVREGEEVVPLSKAEDEEIIRKHAHAVIYK